VCLIDKFYLNDLVAILLHDLSQNHTKLLFYMLNYKEYLMVLYLYELFEGYASFSYIILVIFIYSNAEDKFTSSTRDKIK
jgi:hypothetical protein